MTQDLDQLAMRFAILVTMPKTLFAGHETELGDINDALWDHYGGHETSLAIQRAKETLQLIGV